MTLEPGLLLSGRYEIAALVGEGGLGQVYRARHKFLRTDVAVKVLLSEGATTDSKRFEREAFALGQLSHANCLEVRDFGSHEGRLFLVTEYLRGPSLKDVLTETPQLTVARSLDIFAQLLRALVHAHHRGIVHRDLKPENIVLIEKDGKKDCVKVLDFGLAKLGAEALRVEGGGDLTETGIACGTPRYMAPEQASGGAIDGRTDLYAASVIAFSMLAGRAPFDDADPHDLLMAHCTRAAPTFASIGVSGVPSGLEDVIRKGLAKSAGDRFDDATAYLAAIEGALQGEEGPELRATQSLRRRHREPVPESSGISDVSRPEVDPSGWSRQSWWTAVAAIGVLGLILMVSQQSASEEGDGPSANRVDIQHTPPTQGKPVTEPEDVLTLHVDDEVGELAQIRRDIDAGRTKVAARKLRKAVKINRYKGRAAFLQGTLHFRRLWWSDGFEMYELAIQRDASYRHHPVLIRNAVAGLGSRNKPHIARRFIRKHLRAAALPELDRAATSAKHKHHRANAKLLAAELRRDAG